MSIQHPHRILVTGSREWTDVETIQLALANAWHQLGERRDTILVNGECHLGGADKIAADIWRSWGLPVEGHPAEIGPGGHVRGPERNARMVELGADVCLAFPLPSSRGTWNCVQLAKKAGIQTHVYLPRRTAEYLRGERTNVESSVSFTARQRAGYDCAWCGRPLTRIGLPETVVALWQGLDLVPSETIVTLWRGPTWILNVCSVHFPRGEGGSAHRPEGEV